MSLTRIIGLITLISTFGFYGCGKDSIGPQSGDVRTAKRVEKIPFNEYFDTVDIINSDDVDLRYYTNKDNFRNWRLTPVVVHFQGNDYVLGFNVNGDRSIEVTETTRYSKSPYTGKIDSSKTVARRETTPFREIQNELDWIVSGNRMEPNYTRIKSGIGFSHIDFPDVPGSKDLLNRLDEVNNKSINGDIRFRLIYLRDRDRNVILSPEGENMVNGITIIPIGPNEGYSGMYGEARYIMTE